jgi:hypothetical protein
MKQVALPDGPGNAGAIYQLEGVFLARKERYAVTLEAFNQSIHLLQGEVPLIDDGDGEIHQESQPIYLLLFFPYFSARWHGISPFLLLSDIDRAVVGGGPGGTIGGLSGVGYLS